MEIVDRPDHRLVRLAGRLTEAQAPDLLAACAEGTRAIRLHLGELVSADPVGIHALHAIRAAGAEIVEAPAYIQLKLDALSAKALARRPSGGRQAS
jgi:hypothetical protein